MPDLTPADLDELERLHSEATAGDWHAQYGSARFDGDSADVYSESPNIGPIVIVDAKRADAKFCAAAKNSLPSLIAQAREAIGLRERVEQIQKTNDDLWRVICRQDQELRKFI